jgi:hypothetical protein
VVAVALALSLYAGVLDGAMPDTADRELAATVQPDIEATLAPAGVARPGRLDAAHRGAPAGYRTNLTLSTAGHVWRVGPRPPSNASTASKRVAVAVGPGEVRPGTLTVVVWT